MVRSRAGDLTQVSERLRWHPFSGFEYRLTHPLTPGGAPQRVYAIVDRLTGQATLTDPWPELHEFTSEHERDCVADPGWNTTGFAEAARRARRLVATAAMRRHRLAVTSTVSEVRAVESLWKPNWLLESRLRGHRLQILVDAITGGYYVVGT
ncbi:hypothetical protein [Leucobacter komagatae]|uniref:hypothetical protein n=1 Tax=Leucobacter komagatae TaxID=55969 RepID=UPI000B0D70F5|nr:hypothetical protein [Leucobacter komagatae]